MKHFKYILVILALIAGLSLAQDVSITDYKVPVSTARSMIVNGNYNYASYGDSTTADNGNVRLIYKQFYSSLPFTWTIDVDGSGTKQRDDYTHAVNLASSLNKYVWNERNWFGFGRFQASHIKDFDNPQSRISVGAGYGRFISATAFAKAIRIDNFLLEEGVISGHLDKETLIELGNIIEKEQEYKDIYGSTYEPKWYENMEKVIKASAKLEGENLGAMGILRIKEVLFSETIHDRFYGWEIRAGVGYDLSTAYKSEDRKTTAEAGISFSYPLSLRSQFNHRTQYNSDFNNLGKVYDATSSTDYTYELSNRIDVFTGYQFQTFKFSEDLDAVNSHVLNLSFIFYIENRINLVINGKMDKTADYDWNRSAIVTIGYRIM